MSIKSIFLSRSSLDFSYMFCANLIKKGFGFIREIVLAFFFGSEILYANFLLLKTSSDIFSQFTQGSALQANLLSFFSKAYEKEASVSLKSVVVFAKSISWKIFLVSQIIQIPLVIYISPDSYILFLMISMTLGIVIASNFFSSIFLIILQAKGEFKKFSISTTIDMFMSTVLIYPLLKVFGVIGIVFSRIAGISILIYKYFVPMFKETKGEEIKLGFKDINFSILLLGNFAHIIMFISRFVAGLDDGNNITFFNYSIVLLNVFMTAIIMNLNTIVLKKLSNSKDFKLIVFSFLISLALGLILVFVIDIYGFNIIQFIFQRGAFTSQDTQQTYLYAKDLSFSFVFIFISSVLFQPFFSLDQNIIKKDSKVMALLLLATTLILLLYFIVVPASSRVNSIIMLYTLSVVSVLLSLFSLVKYVKYNKVN